VVSASQQMTSTLQHSLIGMACFLDNVDTPGCSFLRLMKDREEGVQRKDSV
jgi:hypothetical protein